MRNLKVTLFYGTIILIIIIVSILLCHIANYYKYSEEIVAGILAFIGAVIGGSLTLLGVRYTIKNNMKREFINKLPDNISRMNQAIDLILNEVFKELTSKTTDIYDIKNTLIDLDDTLQFRYNQSHKKVTKTYPKVLSDLLLPIDIEIYHNYLEFKKKLNNTENVIYDMEDKIRDLIDDQEIEFNYDFEKGEIIPPDKSKADWYSTIGEVNDVKKIIGSDVLKVDRRYSKDISEAYDELIYYLANKREEMLMKAKK